MNKLYNIIYADPAWKYENEKNNNPLMGGKTYLTMELEDLKNLNVKSLAKKDCSLFMWVTMPKLNEGLETIKAWGFRYITTAFVWVKLNPKGKGYYSGLGHWTNGNVEICLFAKIGKPKRMKKNIKQLIVSPVRKHSQKPDEVRDRIVELLGDLPRIELFAREKINGWDAMGDEIDGKDMRKILV